MKISKKELINQIGISVVAIGLGIGSGEFILWPYLSYHWGFGILWGALFGITMQVILNIEIQRYSLTTNKTIVEGAFDLNKSLGIWFIISTIIGFGWPGFAAGSGYLLFQIFDKTDGSIPFWLPVLMLMVAGLIVVSGRDVYKRIEKLLKFIIPLSFVLILIIFLNFFDWELFLSMIKGMFGISEEGYKLIPKGINLAILLGAIVYSGSGGNLLLSQSYYILEKDKLSNSFRDNHRFQIFENIFIFGGIGLLTILMLSYLSRVLTMPISSILNDISFIPVQSFFIGERLGEIFGSLYLLAGAIALFSVQLGVLDLLGRISQELFKLKFGKNSRQIYSFAIIVQVVLGSLILLTGVNQPFWLIVTGSVFNALAMGVITIVVLILNSKLKEENRPSIQIQLLLGVIAAFYISFFVLTLINR